MKKRLIVDHKRAKTESAYLAAIKSCKKLKNNSHVLKYGIEELSPRLLRDFIKRINVVTLEPKAVKEKSAKAQISELIKAAAAPEVYDISKEISGVASPCIQIKEGKETHGLINHQKSLLTHQRNFSKIGVDSGHVAYNRLQKCGKITLRSNKAPKRDTALILIHGWNGRGRETWGKFPELLESLNKFDVHLYNYPTGIATGLLDKFKKLVGILSYPTPEEVARALKTTIDTEYSSYKAIYLLAHSLGGVIARDYVLKEIREGRKRGLRVAGMILYGSPFNGTEWDAVCKLLQQVVMLKADSDYLKKLQSDWNKHIAGLDWEVGAGVKSDLPTYAIVGARDGVVDRRSASFYANRIKTVMKTHVGLVKPGNNKDEVFLITKQLLLKNFPEDI